ncbi:hypothetical protein EOD39_22079 [Acipenser ruthenus]|uniref:Uncharacterized protein n=1 Tax=Acipenser ruthenus TaxID=7906 RepID=A0A444UQX3_ACIRT|nr:hypothetical protein EOD39_22079 [Acipenser ruthenus]
MQGGNGEPSSAPASQPESRCTQEHVPGRGLRDLVPEDMQDSERNSHQHSRCSPVRPWPELLCCDSGSTDL